MTVYFCLSVLRAFGTNVSLSDFLCQFLLVGPVSDEILRVFLVFLNI